MDKPMPLMEIINSLTAKYGEQVEKVEDSLEAAIRVKTGVLVKVMQELKEDYGLNFLSDLTAMDLEGEGLKGIYHVMSWQPYRSLRVEVVVSRDNPRLPSLTEVWPAANVQEREAFDMLGIIYEGHPKLTRILLSDSFEGYPLLKDFKMPSRR